MSFSPTELSLWQSAIIHDTLRVASGKPIFKNGYTLTFGYPYDYFKLSFDPKGSPNFLDSQRLSHFLSSGNKKAGFPSISGHLYLRGVQDVSVSTKKEDKYGLPYFMIRMTPVEEEGPLYRYFPLEEKDEERLDLLKKED